MEPDPIKKQRLAGLQVLRFVAAALVLWAHAKFAIETNSSPLMKNPFMSTSFGAIGVDIFFVISGFVIALTAEKPGMNWRLFLAQRVARIVPVYYFFIGATVLIKALGHYEFDGGSYWWNTFFFVPLFDLHRYGRGVHNFGWTLSYEMWFYVVFAACLSFLRPNRVRLAMPIFLAVGALLIFPNYSGAWYMPHFAFHPLVLEFCSGCLLFHFRHRLKGAVVWILLCALPAFAYGSVLHERLGDHFGVLESVTLGYQRAGIWGGFAVCLVGCVICLDQSGKVNFPRWLVLLGDASYSIYLIQPLSLKALQKLFVGVGDGVKLVAYVVIAIVGGLLVHLYIEKSICLKTRRFLERLVKPAPAQLLPSSVAGVGDR
ncbi:MAG: acyltransferase [Verrucomicrobiota bacterium]